MNLTKNDVHQCQQKDDWSLGNRILYDLCKKHPRHDQKDEILAKIWLIGRAYSASIERRSPQRGRPKGDRFYTYVVVPKIMRSKIDKYLDEIKKLRPMSERSNQKALQAHKYLTMIFKEISQRDKRSLASKYLHFHLPNHFFIYDNRAKSGLRMILPRQRITIISDKKCDKQYAVYFRKVIELRNKISQEYQVNLTPREIDKMLLVKAAMYK